MSTLRQSRIRVLQNHIMQIMKCLIIYAQGVASIAPRDQLYHIQSTTLPTSNKQPVKGQMATQYLHHDSTRVFIEQIWHPSLGNFMIALTMYLKGCTIEAPIYILQRIIYTISRPQIA